MLLQRIERHLRARRMSPTRFGRESVGDPNLIAQLKDGRELRAATAQRITDYLNDNECEECRCNGCSR
jgi:2,4-dienoyl-CoA reductase-like NADH-dependent reductase (Old Yellow Enzyme family)